MSKPGDEVQEGSRRLSANGSSHISLSRVQGDHGGDVGPEEDSLPASSKSKKSSVLFPSGLSACGGRYVQNVLYCIHHGLQRFIDFLLFCTAVSVPRGLLLKPRAKAFYSKYRGALTYRFKSFYDHLCITNHHSPLK